MTEHVCGLKGYTPWVDPPCPGCEAPMLVMPDLNRQRELPLVVDYQKPQWTHAEAVTLCRLVETVAPKYGLHTALTGGTLYKDGERKDCDILMYRRRSEVFTDWDGFKAAAEKLGITWDRDYGWCKKAIFNGKPVDFFDPDAPDDDDEYPH